MVMEFQVLSEDSYLTDLSNAVWQTDAVFVSQTSVWVFCFTKLNYFTQKTL